MRKQNAKPTTLAEMLQEGIYLLLLLKKQAEPIADFSHFNMKIDALLNDFDNAARQQGKLPHIIAASKFAFCSLLDEIMIGSNFSIKSEWERMPLQLRVFGEHLAGEKFYDKLDDLRSDLQQNIEAIEVFYICLLLGFKGKYFLTDHEKRDLLIRKLKNDIELVMDNRFTFAPNWEKKQKFKFTIRHKISIVWFLLLLVFLGVGIYLALGYALAENFSIFNKT